MRVHFSKVNVVVRLSVCSSAREEEAKCIVRPPAPAECRVEVIHPTAAAAAAAARLLANAT